MGLKHCYKTEVFYIYFVIHLIELSKFEGPAYTLLVQETRQEMI